MKTSEPKNWVTNKIIPLLVGTTILIIVTGIWHRLIKIEEIRIQKLIKQQTISIQTELTNEMNSRIIALERMGQRWERNNGTD